MVKVDFHSHSTFSDGMLSPEKMVNRAFKNNVQYYSLTDHDTISGLDLAMSEANKISLNFIPGIELSTDFNNESIHILGFFRDNSFNNSDFLKSLDEIKDNRKIRAKKIVDSLKIEYKIEIDYQELLLSSDDVIARPHIAKAIIKAGYPYTVDHIFDNFIGKGCKAYFPTTKLSTENGVKLLKKNNALVFLAHPVLIRHSKLEDYLKLGFDGIEAVYSQNSKKQEKNLIQFASKNNLLVSAGSDFHGNIEDTRHGDIGSVALEDAQIEAFLKAYQSK